MKNQVFISLGVTTAAATYIYLGWTIWQIIGAGLVLSAVFFIDERGPLWRRVLSALFVFSLMVLAHFFVTDTIFYWGELLLSAIFFLLAILSLFGAMSHKPGDGSTLTAYMLGLIICIPLGFLFLYQGLENLGYQ